MSKFLKTLLLTAAATGVAAVVIHQIDFDALREDLAEANSDFPGPPPEDMGEEDVKMLLNELASHL